MQKSPKNHPIRALLLLPIVAFCLLVGYLGWLTHRINAIENRHTNKNQPEKPEATGATTVVSGQKGFSATFPGGWSVINVGSEDRILIGGMDQPTTDMDKDVRVQKVEATGGDNALVFMAMLAEPKNFSTPAGIAVDITIGKGEDALMGKKYTHVYTQDELIGIGIQRFAGDRDYEYVFAVDGKELHILYSVYGSDPRNMSTTVDNIVESIRLNP